MLQPQETATREASDGAIMDAVPFAAYAKGTPPSVSLLTRNLRPTGKNNPSSMPIGTTEKTDNAVSSIMSKII